MQKDKIVEIKELFSKGFVRDDGTNKIPEYFADEAINVRFVNGGIKIRNGFTERYTDTGVLVPGGITANETNSKLLFVYGGTLYSIDTTTRAATSIGSITSTARCRFINYGKYTIILTGDQTPFWYDGSSLTQVTGSELDASINPSFGGTFGAFTIINRADTKNVVSVSRPITLANQGYCKDWKGTDAYTISLKGVVQGMCATLSRFWIFTDNSIEFLSPNFLDSVGAYVPTTFADGEVLCSPDCVVPAGDLVFFVTKSKRIRSIGYEGTITEPQIKTLTDLENAGIQKFMDEELAVDQSLAFGHFDRNNNMIKFHFVGINSATPDTILCRDLNTNQWIVDMDKNYGAICTFGTKQFASAAVGKTVYEDETGEDDDGQAIQRSFVTQAMGFSEPSVVKMRRGATIAGQIGYETLIRTKIYIDDILKFDKYIDGSIENPFGLGGVGDSGIGLGGIGDVVSGQSLIDFEKVIKMSRLRATGKKIRFEFSGNNIGQQMVLDYLAIIYRIRARRRTKDKRFTSV